jgi:hypothetical protein
MGSGEIARLNARIGNRRHPARFVLVGICNDEQALRDFRDGALWSRFGSNKLFCPRPSRELCQRLLLHDVRPKIPGGNPEWVERALEFGWDRLGQRDYREIAGHLTSLDELMTGTYQREYLELAAKERIEEEEIRREEQSTRPRRFAPQLCRNLCRCRSGWRYRSGRTLSLLLKRDAHLLQVEPASARISATVCCTYTAQVHSTDPDVNPHFKKAVKARQDQAKRFRDNPGLRDASPSQAARQRFLEVLNAEQK